MAQNLAFRLLRASLAHQLSQRLAFKRCTPSRPFHSTAAACTEGVYKALTEMRVRTPWIQALKERKEAEQNVDVSPGENIVKPDLTPKRMSASFTSLILPLSQDPWLLDTYANYTGQIRTGTLLMDLDALAGVVAYKHTGEGVSTVTAAVDRITIKNPIKEICDLEMSGQVSFATGRSSMEITLQIAKAPTPGHQVASEDIFMTCAFTMVALDPRTKKPINIAPLEVNTPAEKALFAKGEENYRNKKALKSSDIMTKPPDEQEAAEIHKMWTDSLAYTDKRNPKQQPENVLSMSRTTIHSTQIMQPQYRNRHNFMIFGGYLLRQTFELAFTCAAAFSHTRPRFLNLDPSTFEEPVPVGSVLYVSAGVSYTEPDPNGGTRIQVMVRTHVRPVEHQDQERKSTGTFFYTFLTPATVNVLPQSYSEFMRWIAGKRRAARLSVMLESDPHPLLAQPHAENITE